MIDAKQIQAIAFDLDGTLVDSVPDLAAAMVASLDELNLAHCDEQQVRNWVGNGAKKLVTRAIAYATGQEVSEHQLSIAMPIFMKHYQMNLSQHSRLYDDVKPVLTRLFDDGYRLAIVTNKPYHLTVSLLDYFQLNHLFSYVLGGDSLSEMKPNPLPLTHLLDHWQLTPQQLLMVGDSKNDILAAKGAGICSIGLTYGYNYGEDIGVSGPTAVANAFGELLPLIGDKIVMEQ